MLYQHNATLYVAGRSQSKADTAVEAIKKAYPDSKGSISIMLLDLADLPSIKPAVEKFTATEKQLHVLTLNAGVMTPPKGSKTTQGFELQLGTNCIGSYLLYKLLRPTLISTAQASSVPATVRVTWAASLAVDLQAPKPGGVKFVDAATGEPAQDLNVNALYGQSKAGNRFLAAVGARADEEHGILHVAWNPGNLDTELQRHMPNMMQIVLAKVLLFPAKFGGYTELWSAVGPIDMANSGGYVAPWGRIDKNRKDVEQECAKGGAGDKFVGWCDKVTAEYV
ncbi:hypothetical protein FH972_023520 [Carpinus fangiana]|uniref:NAD(P)-binding protein n=1 Tax=Carpinus fangiana TaxID=176857 RepID=A0A5N6KVE3_9ROSI|nr:hypothetical protein FH972_023520 [Carpinus fangiana]